MQATYTIDGRMPGLNEYTRKQRQNRYVGAAMKKRETERAAWAAKAALLPKFETPVRIDFKWIEKNKRRDRDNITFAKKFIIDGLVLAGVIADDGPDYVLGFSDSFGYDKEHPRIVVTVTDEV